MRNTRILSCLWACLFCLCIEAQVSPLSAPKYEVRAAWLTTLKGLDWPSTPLHHPADTLRQQAELLQILDGLQATGINTVLLQTRLRGTLIYPHGSEPTDAALTGGYGEVLPYDPLAFAIAATHARGMQLHAWVVAFPLGDVRQVKRLGKRSVVARYPELCRRAGQDWYLDPGVPGTATYLADLCRELISRYAVDGIHLDYIRYPEREVPWQDGATYRRYATRGISLAEWRSDNVTRCVDSISVAVKTLKPWVRLSCAPVGKYSDLTHFSSGGWNARYAVSQAAQTWLQTGSMDMLFPMMYFTGDHFYPFALDWQEQRADRIIAPGLGIYFLDKRQKDWPLDIIQGELSFLRTKRMGQAFFRTAFLLQDVKGLRRFLQQSFYTTPALIPPMVWADSVPPTTPTLLSLQPLGGVTAMSWQPVQEASPITYNVYCSPTDSIDLHSARHLVATGLYASNISLQLPIAALRLGRIAVTAVDAYGNEGRPLYWPQRTVEAVSIAIPDTLVRTVDSLIITDITGRICLRLPSTPTPRIEGLVAGRYEVYAQLKSGRRRYVGSWVLPLKERK